MTELRYSLLSVFTHLITDSNTYCLTVCFFSSLPQIWIIENNISSKINNCSDDIVLIGGNYVAQLMPYYTSLDRNIKFSQIYYDSNYLNHITFYFRQYWNTRSYSRNSLKQIKVIILIVLSTQGRFCFYCQIDFVVSYSSE